jgi:hypothetical protein
MRSVIRSAMRSDEEHGVNRQQLTHGLYVGLAWEMMRNDEECDDWECDKE